jgi:hypothetical protein
MNENSPVRDFNKEKTMAGKVKEVKARVLSVAEEHVGAKNPPEPAGRR